VNEDKSRIRNGNAPENFAVLRRHIALSLIQKNNSPKGSIKIKRFSAAIDVDYLEEILFT